MSYLARAAAFVVMLVGGWMDAHAMDRAIRMDTSQQRQLGIVIGHARQVSVWDVPGLAATVKPALDDSEVVTAPLAGIVTQVLAREGEPVLRGQVLARIASPEAMALTARLAAARGDFAVAEAARRRDRQLLAEGIIPAARAQVTEARFEAARANLEQDLLQRRLAPPAPQQAGLYELRAPRQGQVLTRVLQPGDAVAELGKAFVIAAGDRLGLDVYVPQQYVSRLRRGMTLSLGDGAVGQIDEMGGGLDPATQTVRVGATVAAAGLHPGMPVTVTLHLPLATPAWSLPAAAIAPHGSTPMIYVLQGDGFHARPVQELACSEDGHCLVTAALEAGAQIVVDGVSAVQAVAAGRD